MGLSHPNIVRCREAFVADGALCIVMEYCSEGEPWVESDVEGVKLRPG